MTWEHLVICWLWIWGAVLYLAIAQLIHANEPDTPFWKILITGVLWPIVLPYISIRESFK